MNENNEFEIVRHEPVLHKALLQKWLPILLYVQCTGMVISALSLIPAVSSWTSWISYIVSIATFSVLFQLVPACGRYRKSAVFYCISLLLIILNAVIGVVSGALTIGTLIGSVITFAASVCTLIAAYQEYYSHAEVIRELDGKQSRRWRNLFVWQIVVGVVLGFGTTIFTVIAVMIGAGGFAAVVVVIAGLSGIALRIVYVLYLRRTLKLLKD